MSSSPQMEAAPLSGSPADVAARVRDLRAVRSALETALRDPDEELVDRAEALRSIVQVQAQRVYTHLIV